MADLSQVPDEELRAELTRRANLIRAAQEARRGEEAERYFSQIGTFLSLVPNHSASSCSDEWTRNGFGSSDTGGFRCLRCALLEIKRDNFWPREYVPEFTLSRRY